jgi:hypothetical protein
MKLLLILDMNVIITKMSASSESYYVFEVIQETSFEIKTIYVGTEYRCKEIVEILFSIHNVYHNGKPTIRTYCGADCYWIYARNKEELFAKINAANLPHTEELEIKIDELSLIPDRYKLDSLMESF